MFFESNDGRKYPVKDIVCIGKAREVTFTSPRGDREGTVHSVRLSDGESVEVHEHRINDLLRQPAVGFAAHSGTCIVTRIEGDTFRWPVIGWSISQDGGVYPVTINGVNSDSDKIQPVLLPDGQVTTFDDNWATLAEWETQQDELENATQS